MRSSARALVFLKAEPVLQPLDGFACCCFFLFLRQCCSSWPQICDNLLPIPSTTLLFWCGVGAKLQSLENARQVLSTVSKPAEERQSEGNTNAKDFAEQDQIVEYLCMWCACLMGKTAGVLYHFPAPPLTQGLLLTLKLGWLTRLHPLNNKGYKYMQLYLVCDWTSKTLTHPQTYSAALSRTVQSAQAMHQLFSLF